MDHIQLGLANLPSRLSELSLTQEVSGSFAVVKPYCMVEQRGFVQGISSRLPHLRHLVLGNVYPEWYKDGSSWIEPNFRKIPPPPGKLNRLR